MDNENAYTVTDLLSFAHEQKPLDFETAFKSVMADKMVAAIDAKKLEVASSLYSSAEKTEEDETVEADELETESEEQEETPEEQTDGETA
jgi:tRNA A37 threonylcarbamoyladenosine modification protein TsaB